MQSNLLLWNNITYCSLINNNLDNNLEEAMLSLHLVTPQIISVLFELISVNIVSLTLVCK